MIKKRRICALLMALGLGIGARTYFLTVKGGRICYRELPGTALVDTGRSIFSLPRGAEQDQACGEQNHAAGPPQGNTVSEPQHPRKKRAEHRGLHNAPADPVVSVFHRFFHGEKSEQPRKTGRQHHSRHRKNLIPRSRLRRCTDPDKTGDSQTAQKHERIKRLPFLRSFAVTDADRPPAYPRQQSEKQSPVKKILHLLNL